MELWKGAHDATWDAAQEALTAAGATDGLPVIPPTRERVEAMLSACGLDPALSIGILPPAYEEVTWRDVAINAVMAGCKPA
ncbi:MAG TPA: UGSC family (seleno)protein, partial [Burkholderiales bacterium]|nr:UGSC family (seleno)protein [Burkholderiales bacterium]